MEQGKPQDIEASEGSAEALVAAAAGFIDSRGLITPGQAVLVAVSGGADSVALLEVLRELAGRPDRRWRLSVAHLHHGLRASADEDAEFVAALAKHHGLFCTIDRRNVAAEAARLGRGIEETARMLRYEFLRETAEAAGADCVAVGHHADDNVETILHRIARGTHLRGLAGMPASRTLAGSAVRLVRPLLTCRRADVEAFCRSHRLAWRHDETNDQTHYTRNFIRHEVLPSLRRGLGEDVDEALLRLAEAAGQAEEYLVARAEELLAGAMRPSDDGAVALDTATLAGEPTAMRQYVVRAAAERAGVPFRSMTAQRLEELAALLDESGPPAMSLNGGFLARRQGGVLVIARPAPQSQPWDEILELPCPGRAELPCGGSVQCETESFDAAAFAEHCRHRPRGVELLDADCIEGPLMVRAVQPGDAFVPLGCSGTQKVSDLLINAKVPREDRHRMACVCDEKGIVYLAPLRIADRVKAKPETRRVLKLTAAE